MSLRQIDLTTALRPALLPDETLLFVQDAVGLYEGKSKLPDYQNGQSYLTSHRVCYVDNEQPRERAVAVNLKDIDRSELYAGFLKSSPKIVLWPKITARSSPALRPSQPNGTSSKLLSSLAEHRSTTPTSGSRTGSPSSSGTWICPICSFANSVPPNFDPALANSTTPLPPCLACGIKPPLVLLVKAAITSMSTRTPVTNTSGSFSAYDSNTLNSNSPAGYARTPDAPLECPRCTFNNDPFLNTCEICGASLSMNQNFYGMRTPQSIDRLDSPAPLTGPAMPFSDSPENIKLSFRSGGEKTFQERLKGALVQRKWLLQKAPAAPSAPNAPDAPKAPEEPKKFGIAGLELRDIELRKNNEVVIGNAFEDLEALMTSAKDIIALAEKFASQTKDPNIGVTESGSSDPAALLAQLNLTTTKDMINNSSSSNLYQTELSRSLAEFLTDDAKGVLKSEGGIMSLVDLWAVFNRARGGVELVSPTDFAVAADLFEKLKLPVRLRRFKSGLLVVQESSRTDEKTIKSILSWLAETKIIAPEEEVTWDWWIWGQGVTAQETAERFGWSVGVAGEELEMAEEQGALCREVSLEGVKFWENWLVRIDDSAHLAMLNASDGDFNL